MSWRSAAAASSSRSVQPTARPIWSAARWVARAWTRKRSGFSSQPHLHFHVCVPLDGEIIRTFPIKFRVSPTAAIFLVQGQSYTAP